MSSRFGFIFWGLLLIILDIDIEFRASLVVDVLPDAIGYFLMVVGCSGLLRLSKQFLIAKNLAILLALLAMFNYLRPMSLNDPTGFAYLILDVLLIWFLMGGIMDFSKREGRVDLIHKASTRRIAYLAVMTLGACSRLVAIKAPAWIVSYSVGLVIGVLIVLIMLLRLIHQVKHELPDRSGTGR